MTITQDSSAPLVVVVGATGKQGGSVVKALAESDKAYRIRALSRDISKPAARALAEQGASLVEVLLVVDNKEKAFAAFEGADYAFLVTDFWAHLDAPRETAEGKLLIDAAKAGGAKGIIWSGLPNTTKLSNGKYTHVYYFDSKAQVTEYGRACGVPFVDVQAGYYADNFLRPPAAPVKQDDGSYAIMWPVDPTTTVPLIDTQADYGLFVRQVLELPVFPDGQEFVAYGENITIADLAAQLGQATGKSIVFQQIPSEAFEAGLKAFGLPPIIPEMLVDSCGVWNEFSWKGKNTLKGLARTPRTWAEAAANLDWSQTLA